jgi:hypothetical protein
VEAFSSEDDYEVTKKGKITPIENSVIKGVKKRIDQI